MNSSITKYDSQRLNNTAQAIEDSIQKGYATEPGFLYAELRAYNATGDTDSPVVTDNSNGNNSGSGPSSSNTALAMYVSPATYSFPHFRKASDNLLMLLAQDHTLRYHRLRFCFVLRCDYFRSTFSLLAS